jgi:hypothetical protein
MRVRIASVILIVSRLTVTTLARISRALLPLAHFIKPIRTGALSNAQFPSQMSDGVGAFQKPSNW